MVGGRRGRLEGRVVGGYGHFMEVSGRVAERKGDLNRDVGSWGMNAIMSSSTMPVLVLNEELT